MINKAKHLCMLLFLSISINLLSQTNSTASQFFVTQNKKPTNYQALIFDPKGWTFDSEYFLDTKIIYKKSPGDSLNSNRIFYTKENTPNSGFYSKLKGNKLISYGDKPSTAKIIYVDEQTLILEEKTYRPGKIIKKKSGVIEQQTYIKTNVRILYKH